GREQEFNGEKRILIDSPKVEKYDDIPEMSGKKVTEQLLAKIDDDEFDFIIVNYANTDMVGHSGNLDAAVKACNFIDKQIELLGRKSLEKDYIMIITADHGNIENMRDCDNNPHTSHTLNKVPFILIGNFDKNIHLNSGSLQDIAPTILSLMNIKKPKDMTGINLIAN
ncbi:alkaline phosphatase family protein, partial [Flavobacteriaceae bacterium]|nr:alkaline phosphatase family protein [Flavobacteriaceae bacterium]